MPSLFSERLDFLMSVTNTTNSALARALSFDASYISRIRSGKRGIPIHQPFIEPAAAYLAGRIREPYQIQALEQALGVSGVTNGEPGSASQTAGRLADWLAGKDAAFDGGYGNVLAFMMQEYDGTGLPDSAELFAFGGAANADELAAQVVSANVRCAFGDAGKRVVTELFLLELAAKGERCNLLVYSDEDMGWLIGDPAFLNRWAALILRVLENGSTMTVVHTVTRGIGEMLDAVRNWLPLYLTGRIQSLYCPRIRDGICKRTLFVAPGACAVVSASVQEATAGMANLLVDDPAIVDAYEAEIRNLMGICRPLVQIIQLSDESQVASMAPLFAGEGPARVLHNVPDELDFTRLAAHAPQAAGGLFEALSSATPERCVQLPENALAFSNGEDAFAVWHLANPSIILLVTERLLAAALTDYLS